MTAAEARAQRFARIDRIRGDQRACAFDFLVNGDDRGLHAKRCVYAGTSTPTCDREYDPGPAPDDIRLYEGSELGALWGVSTAEGAVATLAALRSGWNIKKRSAT
jgi:hypothetical protein